MNQPIPSLFAKTEGLDLRFESLLYSPYLGGVAQLARALAWHARGQGFNSPYLHESLSNRRQINRLKEEVDHG